MRELITTIAIVALTIIVSGSYAILKADGIEELSLEELFWVDKTEDCYGSEWHITSVGNQPVLHKRGYFKSLNFKMVTESIESGIWDATSTTPNCNPVEDPQIAGHDSVRSSYDSCESTEEFWHWVDIWVPYTDSSTTPDDWTCNHYMGVAQAKTKKTNFANLGDNLPLLRENSTVTGVYGKKTTLLYQIPTVIIADFFNDAEWDSSDPDCYDPLHNFDNFGYGNEGVQERASRIMSFVTNDETHNQQYLIYNVYRKAITLLAKIMEEEFSDYYPNGYFRDYDGVSVGGAIIAGSSKRGYGVWKVADLDDRVSAIMSCSFEAHQFREAAANRDSVWGDTNFLIFYNKMIEEKSLWHEEYDMTMPIDTSITYWLDMFDYFEPASYIDDIDPTVWTHQIIGTADLANPLNSFPMFVDSLAVLHPETYDYVYSPGWGHGMGSHVHAISWWQLIAHYASDIKREFTNVTMDTTTSAYEPPGILVGAKIDFPRDTLNLVYTLRNPFDVPEDAKYSIGLWYAETDADIAENSCGVTDLGPIFFACPDLWDPDVNDEAGILPMTSAGNDSYYVTIDRPDSGYYKAIFVQVWEEVWPDCTQSVASVDRIKGHGVASSHPLIIFPPE